MHSWVNLQLPNNWGFTVINEGKYGLDYSGVNLGITIIHGQDIPPRMNGWIYEERFKHGYGFTSRMD